MSDAVEKGRGRDDSASVWDSSLKDSVDYLARVLVDQPEQVEVEEIEEPDALVFELKVAEEDLGKVICKQGRTAKALRTILSAASAKSGRRVILEILEYGTLGQLPRHTRTTRRRSCWASSAARTASRASSGCARTTCTAARSRGCASSSSRRTAS